MEKESYTKIMTECYHKKPSDIIFSKIKFIVEKTEKIPEHVLSDYGVIDLNR